MAFAVLIACLPAFNGLAEDDAEPRLVFANAGRPNVQTLQAWIAGVDTTAETRRSAVELLVTYVQRDADDEALPALIELLGKDSPAAVQRLALQEIVRSSTSPAPEALPQVLLEMRASMPAESEAIWAQALGRYEVEEVAKVLAKTAENEQAPMEQRRLAIHALGEHRQLFAAKALIGLTSINRMPQVQDLAMDALGNLSHQPGVGRVREAWAGWYNLAKEMDTAQWQRMLHENLLRKTRDQKQVDLLARERLIQTQRALYRATVAEQRPLLLIHMLKDPLDGMRALALDLARQRAEDNGEFGPELREELRARLTDPLPKVREESATLLGQLLDPDAADIIAEQLVAQTQLAAGGDPAVNQAYLLALAKMPRERAVGAGYAMLLDPGLRPSAAAMLAASQRAGQGEKKFWRRVHARVQEALKGIESPKPEMVTLFGLLTEPDDAEGWARIGGWLDAKDNRVRDAAARSWAESTRSLAVLAERCDDPAILPIALKAIAERGSQKETLKAVAARRPSQADDIRLWEQAMVALAGRVPPASLLDVIDSLADKNGETRQVRENMLTASIEREGRPEKPTRDELRLLIVRAQTRVPDDAPALVVKDYEAALTQADTLTPAQAEQARRGLAGAYLTDGRITDALSLATAVLKPQGSLVKEVNADPLLDRMLLAARKAVEQGRKDDASAIVTGVQTLVGEAISDQRKTQLQAIQAEIAKDGPAQPAP